MRNDYQNNKISTSVKVIRKILFTTFIIRGKLVSFEEYMYMEYVRIVVSTCITYRYKSSNRVVILAEY